MPPPPNIFVTSVSASFRVYRSSLLFSVMFSFLTFSVLILVLIGQLHNVCLQQRQGHTRSRARRRRDRRDTHGRAARKMVYVLLCPTCLSANENMLPSQNTGKVTGTEVVQVYCEDPIMKFVRPWKRLIAFNRVTLAGGSSVVVQIHLTSDQLEFYDDDLALRVVPGDYTLSVGGSSYSAANNTLPFVIA